MIVLSDSIAKTTSFSSHDASYSIIHSVEQLFELKMKLCAYAGPLHRIITYHGACKVVLPIVAICSMGACVFTS